MDTTEMLAKQLKKLKNGGWIIQDSFNSSSLFFHLPEKSVCLVRQSEAKGPTNPARWEAANSIWRYL